MTIQVILRAKEGDATEDQLVSKEIWNEPSKGGICDKFVYVSPLYSTLPSLLSFGVFGLTGRGQRQVLPFLSCSLVLGGNPAATKWLRTSHHVCIFNLNVSVGDRKKEPNKVTILFFTSWRKNFYSILPLKCTNKTIAIKLKRINHNARNLCDCFFFFKILSIHLRGGHGVYGIAVLSFFSKGISKILILMCSIAVSSSPGVCGFSHFWLTVFSKRRSFMVLRYRSFALSCLM